MAQIHEDRVYNFIEVLEEALAHYLDNDNISKQEFSTDLQDRIEIFKQDIIAETVHELILTIVPRMNPKVFKETLVKLENLRNSNLCEYDDALIANFYNESLSSKDFSDLVNMFVNDMSLLDNGNTFGDHIKFIKTLS